MPERYVSSLPRRAVLVGAVAAWLAMTGAARPASAAEKRLRISVQKYGTLVILWQRGTLASLLAKHGWSVQWTEFPAGPQLLEALNAGALDFGATGETPPIFAQAAGAPLVYVAAEPPSPEGEAILVPQTSPTRTLADLRGKRVALNKGSNVHYLLVQALAAAHLAPADIQPVYLAPADARAAFQEGAVDAWAIWDPFLAAAQAATSARVLTDARGLAPNRQFFLATRDFATRNPEIVALLMEQIRLTDAWAEQHQAEVAALLSPRLGVPVPVLRTALGRMAYGVGPVTSQILADQQRIADAFHALRLVPVPVTVRDAHWAPPA